MRKLFPFAVVLFFIFSSCQKQPNDEATKTNDSISKQESNPTHNNDDYNSQNSLNYIGIYNGILPCADCEGIETKIVLNENLTFTLLTKYLGKGNKIFEEHGAFKWNNLGNTITLGDAKNVSNHYLVGKNSLTQLDVFGKKITSDLSSDFILSKTMITSEFSKPIEEIPSTEKLNNRMVTRTVIKSVDPAQGKFALAKTNWKLIQLNGKKVKQNGNKNYFIRLNSKDGKFNGFAGCNNFSGNYAMPSSFAISFSNISSTMKACPNMELESQLMKVLEIVDNYYY
jgi:uncharacterized lipoprotein NlpE involved in copper resistance/heat shock protein HslJ